MIFIKKVLGNCFFRPPPYEVRHKHEKVWLKNALLKKKCPILDLDIFGKVVKSRCLEQKVGV